MVARLFDRGGVPYPPLTAHDRTLQPGRNQQVIDPTVRVLAAPAMSPRFAPRVAGAKHFANHEFAALLHRPHGPTAARVVPVTTDDEARSRRIGITREHQVTN